ncbi:hypothetical protein [Streptomyces zagrosensis]|uniref:Uncharacterized protein n=1 Tax=Streptomyces zagrosensis TaxID=1042984 RepID=A0A7W9QB61_9ACTN|nr:hypothetical protein [Streptomyces zagrosensis]MBB5936935.1 hypothetical protein [Streptomyces zagrosensis]
MRTHARPLTAETGLDNTNDTAVARVLDALLTCAEHDPGSLSDKVSSSSTSGPSWSAATATYGGRTRPDGLCIAFE